MSLQAGEEGRLDFVLDARCLRTEASFDVVSEAPAVSVVPGGHGGGGGELVAGLEQEVRLALTTGSRHIQEVHYLYRFKSKLYIPLWPLIRAYLLPYFYFGSRHIQEVRYMK